MVACFLVQTLSQEENFYPGVCYWEPYSFVVEKESLQTNTRTKERDALQSIMLRVQTEYYFQISVPNITNARNDNAKHGMFKVKKQNNFLCDYTVIWRAAYDCAFVHVLKANENIPLAEHILNLIIGYATNIFNMTEDSYKQLIAYPDKMVSILHTFLPCGRLIFMNHRLIKQNEKELDRILSQKK